MYKPKVGSRKPSESKAIASYKKYYSIIISADNAIDELKGNPSTLITKQ